MRRFLKWAALVALGLLMTAPNAVATPTVSGHTGHADSTFLALAGAGFTTAPPTVAYFFDFENANPADVFIKRPSRAQGRKYPDYSYGTTVTNHFWHDLFDSTGYSGGPRARVDAVAAKHGSYGLVFDASRQAAVNDTTTWVRQYFSAGSDAGDSAFLSFWFKIVANDTTMLGTGRADSVLNRFSLVRLVGLAPANSFDPLYVSTTTDSLKGGIGFGSVHHKKFSWDLGKSTFASIANGAWHRFDCYVRADADTTAASGKVLIYLDYALMDSSNTVLWPRRDINTTVGGWNAVQLCPIMTEDDGRDMRVYFDDIYIAGGADFNIGGTPTYNALARVEYQDKITFGNATERYVQFPVSWADAAITVRHTGDFAATDKVYILPIPSGGDLLLQADTCLDSLQTAVPVLGSATLSDAATQYPAELATFTWTDTADNGLLGRDSKKTSTTIDWGDGSTSTLSTPGDTTATHEYQAPGTYTITVVGTNAAGSTTKTTSYTVNSQKVRYLIATGSMAIIPNNDGENRITLDPVIGPTYVKLRHLNVGWDAAPWPVPAEGFTVSGDVDSVKVTALAGSDTLRVHVH